MNVGGYLLDTDVVIDWLRGRETSVAWMKRMAQTGARLAISGITVAEILSGTSEEQRSARKDLLRAFEYVDYTFPAACLAGELRQAHLRAGNPIALPDLMQAAIAMTAHLTVATANTKHFPDVNTVNPRAEG